MTIQTLLQARRARRAVTQALSPVVGARVQVQCVEGTPVQVQCPLPPKTRSADADATAEEVAARLSSWGDWDATVDHSRRQVIAQRLPDWPETLAPATSLTSRPILGARRTLDGFHAVTWEPQKDQHLLITGWARGKTVLARGVAGKWPGPGPVTVLGREDEWDSARHRLVPDLPAAIEALEHEAPPSQPLLVVVDGLDDHVVDEADDEDVEHLHLVLRRLALVPHVHLLVIAQREDLTWASGLRVFADHRRVPTNSGRLLVTRHGQEIEILPPYVDPPDADRRVSEEARP